MQGSKDRGPARIAPARSALIVLAVLASGCSTTSKLPWHETKLQSIKLHAPSQSYAPDARPNGRLPGRQVKLPSHKLARPANDFGVGARGPADFHLPFLRPKPLESYGRTSPFD